MTGAEHPLPDGPPGAPGPAPGPGVVLSAPGDAGPDLRYSDTEDELRAAVRALLADRERGWSDRGERTGATDPTGAAHRTDHVDPAPFLTRAESGDPYDRGLWHTLATGIGAAGLLVPERLGGQGASHREAAVVLEELGRTVTPAPYLTGSVVATETLLALDTGRPELSELLAAVASGHRIAVLAVPFATSPYGPLPTGAPRITGVADAAVADVLLVPRPDGLYAVDASDVTLEALTPLDLTRPLAAVSSPDGRGTRLGDPVAATAAVRRGLLTGAGLLASEQLGVAVRCLEETVRHTRERHQFNRPVGSFQALKHRMARMWLEIVSARAAARNAADALATGGPDTAVAVAVAQAYASGVAVRAAEECVQLHGGTGMTWEHPAHLFLKRAKSAEIAFGTPGRHKAALADLVTLPAP
ncbi:acyl-CoA dehydrogenase family protein [Streptomyces sp. NPDC020965]|uniref:acyl-CoA dehydrogenase family protein n=1 Tax=Streptomyces sp. NPDC020965 TaxID=3365105 RepID=UPI00379B8F72